MTRRSIFTFSAIAILGLVALLPIGAAAQQKSLKEQLVGTWTLVSYDGTGAEGARRQLSGSNVKGILCFDAGGRYATVFERVGRAKFKTASQPTTGELAAATGDFFAANFGTWSVNEADKVLAQRFDGALRPNNEGADAGTLVCLVTDELKLTTVNPLPTGAKIEQVYRRAK
jgi:Lipocalin-like domain